ncbi:unnamed protein product [Trichobilharzia szidati]|nr:unnamed protein product [Trichobilharzia szidati]
MNQYQFEKSMNRISPRATRQNTQEQNITNLPSYTTNYSPTTTSTTSPSLHRRQVINKSADRTECYSQFHEKINSNHNIEYRRREYRLPGNIESQQYKRRQHNFIHLSLPSCEEHHPTSNDFSPLFSSTVSSSTCAITSVGEREIETSTYRSNLNSIGKALSFSGRSTDDELNENKYSDQNRSQRLQPNSQVCVKRKINRHMSSSSTTNTPIANNNPTTNQQPTVLTTKRGHLAVTPSIEISLVSDETFDAHNNNNDNANEQNDETFTPNLSTYSVENRNRRNSSRQRMPNMRSSSLRIDADTNDNVMPGKMYNRPVVSNQYLSTQNELKLKGECEETSTTPTTSHGRRGKLIRQSRSFQNPLEANNNLSSEGEEVNSDSMLTTLNTNRVLDDFDYFCRIANVQPNESTSKRGLHPPLSASYARSNSMREYGVERQKSVSEVSGHSSPGGVVTSQLDSSSNSDLKFSKGSKSAKSSFLKPPSNRQLRRANTEEDPLNKSPLMNKRPLAATLSYTSMTSSYSNLCISPLPPPPKSIPCVPLVLDDLVNTDVPLGVPLSIDSMVADEPGLTFYQVQVLGSSGVGKTSLCQQLASLVSENSSNCDPDETDNPSEVYSITTALCGSVYTVNFVDSSADNFEKNLEVQIRDCIDAFLVVYAIDDENSFEAARLIINALTPLSDTRQFSMLSPKKMTTMTTNSMTSLPGLIYLVGNKSDLVRGRQVSTEEGRHLAAMHGAKFIEVSASLNHMVADLFVLLIGHLHESEQRGRSPRLPTDRRVNPLQSSLLLPSSSKSPTNTTSIVNTFKIPTVTKASFSKFLKKHFTRSSQESE